MGRRSNLPYVVECKSTYVFFEVIAAFDCDRAAKVYADVCADTNKTNTYRAVHVTGRKRLEIK